MAQPEISKFNRRHAIRFCLSSLLAGCPLSTRSDDDLLLCGREFDVVAARLDKCIDHRLYISDELIDRLGAVLRSIKIRRATTFEGLQVKARVASWDLSENLSLPENCGLVDQMSYSIFTDLLA